MRSRAFGDLQGELAVAGVELAKGSCIAPLKACKSSREVRCADALPGYVKVKGISRDASDYLTTSPARSLGTTR